jgi:hypothetical protein
MSVSMSDIEKVGTHYNIIKKQNHNCLLSDYYITAVI